MASEDSRKDSSIYCEACNIFVDSLKYNDHIQEKRHKKNNWKKMNSWGRSKETLNKPQFALEEPSSLDVQFQSFLDQVLLTKENCSFTSSRILHDLEPCLIREFGVCYPYVFGSMVTGLALVGSDIDIYLDTGIYNYLITLPDPKPELQRIVARCARALRTDGRFSQIVPISQARVPIVKLVHNPSGLSCDISFKDSLGVHNSKLLRFYLLLNTRLFEVMVVIKFWAKAHGLCGTDGISSYGWTLLYISFLQTLKLPSGNSLVPSVYQLQKGFRPHPSSIVNGWRVDFHPSQNFVALPDEPQFSYHGLLKGFFDYYSSFSFEQNIVCPFLGQPIPWSCIGRKESGALPPEYQWYESQLTSWFSEKVYTHRSVCIQDPFQQDFVLGGSCSNKNFEKVRALINAAAQICKSEQELADPNASTFLTQLFTSKFECFQETLIIRLKEIRGVQREDLTEEAFRMLEEVFKKIMKFEMECEPVQSLRPSGEPDIKVFKKTECQDVHQRNDGVITKMKYTCVSVHPVWRMRKKSRKDVKIAFPETAFEFEEKLSSVVESHNYPSERIEFCCDVEFKKSSLELVLKQSAEQSNKNIIKELIQFLRGTLQVWMNTFLLEKFTEPSNLYIRSEPCSSTAEPDVVEAEESEIGSTKDPQSDSESKALCEISSPTADKTQQENCHQTVEDS